MRVMLWWAWRRAVSDPARLLVLAGLLLAAATAAALPLTADGALAGALRAALGGGASSVGGRVPAPPPAAPVELRFTPGPGTAPASAGVFQGLRRLAAEVSPLTGAPAGAVVLAGESVSVSAFAPRAPGRPGAAARLRRLGRLRVVAVEGLIGHVRWVAGRPFASRPGPDGVVEAAISRSLAREDHLAPGDALGLSEGSAAAPRWRLRVVGVFVPLPAASFWPFPASGVDVAVAFPLFAANLASAPSGAPPSARRTAPPARVSVPGGSLPPASDLEALAPLDMASLSPARAGAAYRGLAALGSLASRRLPGAVLAASPRPALGGFLRRRALWLRQLALSALPALLCALATAVFGGWLVVERDRERLGVWLTRGASPWSLASLYLSESLAMALAAAVAGALLAARVLHAGGHSLSSGPSGAAFAWAGAVAAAGALVVVVPLALVLRRGAGPYTPRQVGPRLFPLAASALAAALAVGGRASLGASAAVGHAAATSLFGAQPWDPLALERPTLFVLPVLLLAGVGFGLTRAGLAAWARYAARRPPAGVAGLLAARRLARLPPAETVALGLIAVAIGAAVWAGSASGAYRVAGFRQAELRVGAPVRLLEEIPAACDALVVLDGEHCLRGGVEIPAPVSDGTGPSWLGWPVPPDPNRGLPGVAAATRVFSLTLPDWPSYSETVRYMLLDPRTYASLALWPGGDAAAAVRLLSKRPGQLVLVGGSAAVPGIVAGDYFAPFPCLVFAPDCPPRIVAATSGPWPGEAPRGPPLFVGTYGAAGPVPDLPPSGVRVTANGFTWRVPLPKSWPLAPLRFDEFLRLRPGAPLSAVLVALRARGVRILGVETPQGAAGAALARPTARGRLALWRLDRWAAVVSTALLGLLLLALAARRRGAERRLLAAFGAAPAAVAVSAWMETVALLGLAVGAGWLAGRTTAMFSDPWLVAFSSNPPTLPVTPAASAAWWAWFIPAAALAWVALELAGRARARPDSSFPGIPPDRERQAPSRAGDAQPRFPGRLARGLARAAAFRRAARVGGMGRGPLRSHPWLARSASTPPVPAPSRVRSAPPRLTLPVAVGAVPEAGRLRAAVLLALSQWRSAPRRVAAVGLALALAAWVGAAASAASHAALSSMLAASLTPQNGRPAGAVLLLQNAGGPGRAVQPGAAAGLARAADALPGLTGLSATPTVRVTETVSMPVYLDHNGQPTGSQPLALVELDAQPGLAAHVDMVEGVPPGLAAGAGGVLQGVLSEQAQQQTGMLPGGVYDLEPAPGYGPPLLRLQIVGVFRPRSPSGPFWPYSGLSSDVFVAPAALAALVQSNPRMVSLLSAYRVLAVGRLTPGRVGTAVAGLEKVQAGVDLPGGNLLASSPLGELQGYLQRAGRLRTSLWMLALPSLAAAILLAVLTGESARRAGDPAFEALAARGVPGAGVLAAFGGLLPLGAGAVVVGAAVAGLLTGVPPAVGAGAAWGVARLLPSRAAWAGSALAVGLALGATLLAAALSLWIRPRSLATRRAWAARPPAVHWPALVLAAGLLCVGAVAYLDTRAGGGPAPAPLAALSLPPLLLLGTVLGLLGAGRLAARVLERGRGAALGLGTLLVARRLSRSPGRWTAAWMLAAFALGQAYAAAGTGRALLAYRRAAAGLAVGADAAVGEGWTSACSQTSPSVPVPAGLSVSPYQRFVCMIGDRPWGRSVFAYQLPPPPPAPFSVNDALPGVRAATPLLEVTGTLALPGGAATAAQVVGIQPQTYGLVAWWRATINPLSLGVYLRGAGRGRIFVGGSWAAASGLRPGQRVVLTLNGRSLALPYAGPVRVWPGVDPQGTLVVGDATDLQRAFSLKPVDYQALLRLRPGADLSRMNPDLQSRGLFVTQSSSRSSSLAIMDAAPALAALAAVLSAVGAAMAAAAAGGFLLLLLLRPHATGELGLLAAVGVERGTLALAERLETVLLWLGGSAAGLLAGPLVNRLVLFLLHGLWGAGGLPGAHALPSPAAASPLVVSAPGPVAIVVFLVMSAAVLGVDAWSARRTLHGFSPASALGGDTQD